MQSLSKKLQLKPGYHILALNAPQNFAETLQAEGCHVTETSSMPESGTTYDAVQLFVKDSGELNEYIPLVVMALKTDGLLWIAYPKKSSQVKSDLTRDKGWEVVFELGYEGVRQVAIDETWSSLRFRHMSERKGPSKFGVDMPGIDREARTVEIPDDLMEALEAVGLLETFEKLAFTHRKEHVLAIMEAKRPETRANRIGKTIEMLLGQQAKR
ncbi:YdeI/OmpD-associated family protein [Pontibacter sp. JH31]|uniref:YdeI/OmpD-associated family protein n=1 Tax=Pontibacter aquaedesilientis TaxID=2766980 RepID=A0ABR7XH54_9BACT|nr:YdeI/OmpD-associated family protein [Pontibacter aquaedesilientis]MBD1397276.1 YdeI/OmpD-associated family protein [Pontibacter aquaedesilientis]